MSKIEKIKALRKKIKDLQDEILKIEKSCEHKRIRVKESPDCYCGWSVSKSCADCGKFFGCSTGQRSTKKPSVKIMHVTNLFGHVQLDELAKRAGRSGEE